MTSSYLHRITRKLTDGLKPTQLIIRDESRKHAGHGDRAPALATVRGGKHTTETHFHIEVTSTAFEGVSALARQRMVYALLTEELEERVHALSIVARAPREAG